MKKTLISVLTVLLVLSLVVSSVFAFTSPVRTYSFFSLNPDNSTRTVSLSGSVRYGLGYDGYVVNTSSSQVVTSVSASTGVSGGALTSTISGSLYHSSSVSGGISVSSGTYLGYDVPLDYSSSEYNRLILSGTFKAILQTTCTIRNGVGGSLYPSSAWVYPDVCDIYFNDVFFYSIPVSDDVFSFDGVVFDFDEDITSVKLRFYFTSTKYDSGSTAIASSPAPYSYYLTTGFTDNVVINAEYITPETPVYQSQLNEVISWLSSISLTVSRSNSLLANILDSIGGLNEPDSALGRLANVFARDDDIQLRDDVDPVLQEVTDVFFDTESNPTTAISADKITTVGESIKGVDSMFQSGYDATDAFQDIADNQDDYLAWFSADTASWLDTVNTTSTIDDSDPFNMWRVQEQYNEIEERRGKD